MTPASKAKIKVQTGVTVVLGLFAIGIIGTIIGYWLK